MLQQAHAPAPEVCVVRMVVRMVVRVGAAPPGDAVPVDRGVTVPLVGGQAEAAAPGLGGLRGGGVPDAPPGAAPPAAPTVARSPRARRHAGHR